MTMFQHREYRYPWYRRWATGLVIGFAAASFVHWVSQIR